MDTDITTGVETAIAQGIRATHEAGTGMDARRRALEIGSYLVMVPAIRHRRVDSAELIGFVYNTDPVGEMDADVLAAAIVDRFNLEEIR
jgi:hypothetical protein